MITIEEFKELKRIPQKECIEDIINSNNISTSLSKLGITSKDDMIILYEKLYNLIEVKGQPLTISFLEENKKQPVKFDEAKKILDEEYKETKKIRNHLICDDFEPVDNYLYYKCVSNNDYELKYMTDGSVGIDLYLDNCITDRETGNDDVAIDLLPGQCKIYGTGVAIELPEDYYAEIVPRSSLCSTDNSEGKILLANSVGVIDSDYRGEIKLKFVNVGNKRSFGPKIGERIAQLIIKPVTKFKIKKVDELSETLRGDKGFGSTGVL